MADKSMLTKAAISVVLSAGLVVSAMLGPEYAVTVTGGASGGEAASGGSEALSAIMESYTANGENNNDYRVDYLEQDPYLVNLYEGYGFAVDYTSAIAHNYTLEDVANTERPHALANCLTCKTSDFTKLVQELGTEAYSKPFDEVYPDMKENVGCYNCHADNFSTTGELVATHDYTIDKLGDDEIAASTLVCGQCHIEYYFDPETKATTTPYEDVASMDPEKILAYYDEIGFADWTQESTGTPLIKAQHPEMETYLNGSIHAGMGLTCASCHMEKATTESGVTYSSHKLVSPLSSDAILETCAQCHGDTDIKAKVAAIQEEITARETEVGNALSDMKTKLADAVASGEYTEEQLEELRGLHRSAQWYFDFDYVENSEGAHNSALAKKCLNKAEELINEANAILDGSADAAPADSGAESAAEVNGAAVESVAEVSTAAAESVAEADAVVQPANKLAGVMDSYNANGNNNYRVDYLEQDPYLVEIYEGYGFAKDYTSAIAHNYTLEDVANTERPHALANCLTCKTSDFTKLVQELGTDAYSKEFDEVYPDMKENVGCYNCHSDQMATGELVPTHDYTIEKLGDDEIKAQTLVCGQCHIEYYFDPDTKATTCPYEDVAGMDPEAILAYYDEMGFADWTQESTGTKLVKAQHPEMETVLGAGNKHQGMFSCADCHMETLPAQDGDTYVSHSFVTPLDSAAIFDAKCASCHQTTEALTDKVRSIQAEITERETAIGNSLAELKKKLAEAVASGEYSDEELEAIRSLHRSAQWFFDFDYVENSEGAHNSTLAKTCLDKAEGFINEAMALFK